MNGFKINRLALVSLLFGLATCAPEIKTSVGVLKGTDGSTPGANKPYHAYYGIPYAAAPVGDLRFRPPQAFTSDDASQVLTSDNFKPACPQTMTFGNTVDEDCLFLNVFTPSTGGADFDTNAKMKVLVYIHGGAFYSGDTSIYPLRSLAAEYGLVVVTLQYRLGPLGFMSSGTSALPGNYGLRDQIEALKWVKQNIAMFGGDPDDVTLSGESAGATSCSLISISPMTKGLFNRVILLSGSALAPWAIDLTSRETFDKMAQRSQCIPDPCEADCDSKIVDCMRKLDAMDVINLMAKDAKVSAEDIFSLNGYMSFAPVVDGDVLPRDPFELIKDADYMTKIGAVDREYLIGVNNNEAMLFTLSSLWSNVVSMSSLLNIDDPVAKKVVANNLHTVFPYPVSKATVDLVAKEYYNPRDANGMTDLQTAINFMSDIDFVVPAIQLANHLVALSDNIKVYLFLFDLFPPLKSPDFPLKGSTHGTELLYLMDEPVILADVMAYADFYADECKPIQGILRGMVSTFAKTGDPSLPGAITWPQYDSSAQKYLSVSTTPEVQSGLFQQRISLWTVDLPKALGMTTFLRGQGRAPVPVMESEKPKQA